MRRLLALVVTGLVLVGSTGAAGAQNVDDIVEQVELRGYFVESGADADINELERIAAEAAEAGGPVAIVILAAEAEGGDDLLADQVFSATTFDTVVVVSDVAIGARSVFEDSELAEPLEAALEAGRSGGSNEQIVEAFVDALPSGGAADDSEADAGGIDEPAAAAASQGDDDGGGISILWILLPIVAIGGLIWFVVRRRKRSEGADADDVEVARAEIRDQLEVIANEILENQDTIELSENEEAITHYREANATYAAAVETLDTTTNLLELADLNVRVDRARWQLEAAEALVDGRPVPPEPEPDKPVACFFDPTHRPGTEDAVVRTAAGDKQVEVCQECADKLRRGERPTPREISVRGRRVPSAKAPQSHGGRGMGGLDVFDVVLGGLGGILGGALGGGGAGRQQPSGRSDGTSFDWGDALGSRRSRRKGGVFGPDRLPPGGRGLGRRGGGGGRVGRGRARGRF